ncbi:hypothetical protein K3495_g13791 [Podosphaera aphanis]|nr:hypothetical protein K3495_g13791 [Podosphaera aphanis]
MTSPPIPAPPPATQSKSFEKWPKWSGSSSEFATFQICLEGISSDDDLKKGLGSPKAFCYGVFTHSLPPIAQKGVAPWMKRQKKSNEWNIDEFIYHLEELFINRDASSKALTALHKLRQGS